MTSTTRTPPPIRFSAQMRQRFNRDAPAALARRNNAYLLGVAVNVAQWLLIGGLGLLGLYHWRWTAGDMLLVFVAGVVASILADALKWVFARRRMLAEYQTMENDRLVWAMLDAETQQTTEIPAHRIEPRSPGRALLMDLVSGALGLWALSAQRPAIGLDAEAFAGLASDVQLALLAMLLAPVLSMLAAAFAHRRTEGGYDDLEFRAGGRGIGLLLLAAALAFSSQGEEGARGVMLFIHWTTVVAGVLSVAGVAIMALERNRLRRRLSDGHDDATDPSSAAAGAQTRKPGERR
jgi:hypothetical protein